MGGKKNNNGERKNNLNHLETVVLPVFSELRIVFGNVQPCCTSIAIDFGMCSLQFKALQSAL